ncbi:MAG TPA: hypothetical protein VK879_06410 [Candidatus Sulfomarinibacteraceae bacterium]|nr:hypothetical protein [Candidatus Sulfomarinibacteraceae bacterium]
MSDAASAALPLHDADDNDATPQRDEPVRWAVVAEARGLLPARIIASRLQTEGIPARAWQESVGQAYGMFVGPLGTGYVFVPEEFAEQARRILDDQDDAAASRDDDRFS